MPTANLLKSLESRPEGGVTRILRSTPAGRPPVRHSGGSLRSGARGPQSCWLSTRFRKAAGKRVQRCGLRALRARGERPAGPPRPRGPPREGRGASLNLDAFIPPALSAFNP